MTIDKLKFRKLDAPSAPSTPAPKVVLEGKAELKARVRVGERIVALQRGLADRVRDLEDALAQVTKLRGLLPICAWCKSVRSDGDYWQSVEGYLAESGDVRVSHGICPDCAAREAAG